MRQATSNQHDPDMLDAYSSSRLSLWETVGRVERQRNPTSPDSLHGILRPTLKVKVERLI